MSVLNLRTSNWKMASAVSLKHHTPLCRGNCNLLHHDLVAALFTDGRCAISRIERPGDLPLALKQAIETAKLSGWDYNCFIPDPLELLRCPLLFLASAFGKVAILEGLLRNDFSPRVLNQDGETALHFAVKHFHLNRVTPLQGRKGRKEAFEKIVDLLTEYDPKILAVRCKNGRTALHVAACSFSKWKVDFYQFSTKLMMERLVALQDSSVLTRKEVMDIVKAPDLKGDTFMHMLARNSAYFEALKFGGELLFRGKLPEDRNKQGKTILTLAWETNPREATKMLSTLLMHNREDQEGRSTEIDPEERISADENLVATNSPAHRLASLEFSSEGEQSLCHLSVADEGIPYIDQVFSLSSGDNECNLSSPQEDTINNEVCSVSSEECVARVKKSYSSEEPKEGEIKKLCVEATLTSSSECLTKFTDADSSFLEFVKTEGLGLHAQTKKNIVGVVMTEYSNKLREIESRLPMLGQLISEEEMALRQKEEREQALEEELDLLKKEMLEKQRCINDLRQQCESLRDEKLLIKRKVVYCQEVEQQLESGNGSSLKKVRSE